MPILGPAPVVVTPPVPAATPLPFAIRVYDKTMKRVGFVGDPTALQVTVRHNALSTAVLTLPTGHRQVANLIAPGARLLIDYDGRHLIGGPVRLVTGSRRDDRVEFLIEDDFRLLLRVLGWANPAAALTAQTPAYDTRTGAAETVVKAFVTANAITRLGLPVTVAPSQSRGSSITVRMRFHPLADRLFPAVDLAGVGVTVRQVGTDQQGTSLQVDCYTPAVSPRTLTEASGVVVDYQFSSAGMTVSDVVVGQQGEDTARVFDSGTDAARRTLYADRIEVFRDGRDSADPTVAQTRIAETLAEGAARSGLQVSLAETSTFRYGKAVNVGDRVRIEVGPTFVEDVLREAVLSYTADAGLVITPVVGERTDDPSRTLARVVAGLAKAVRQLGVR